MRTATPACIDSAARTDLKQACCALVADWQPAAQVGNHAQARKYFEGAIVANPRHGPAWHGWGMLEKQLGNLQRARNLFAEGVRKTEGRNAYLLEAIGTLAADAGLDDEARYWYRRGVNNQPNGYTDHTLWTSWGLMEWKLVGDVEQVLACAPAHLWTRPIARCARRARICALAAVYAMGLAVPALLVKQHLRANRCVCPAERARVPPCCTCPAAAHRLARR
jgi:tetratricopeptide (TPR) repeat protein